MADVEYSECRVEPVPAVALVCLCLIWPESCPVVGRGLGFSLPPPSLQGLASEASSVAGKLLEQEQVAWRPGCQALRDEKL